MNSMASASTPRQAPTSSQAYMRLGVAGCDRDRVRLLDKRRGRGELPAEQVHARPVDERDGKQGERAGVPGQLHRASGERVERVVVPQLEHGHRLDDRRQQEPAHDRLVAVERLGHDRLEREPERRHARAGSLRAPARQAVENEVDRSRRRGRDGGSSGRLGNLQDTGVGIDASGVHRRSERLEICLARQRGIERFEPSGGVEKERRTVAAAREDERDLRAQSLQQRALKLVQRSELGRREQRLGGLAASRLQLGLRGGERARAASCRVRGQLGRSLQERGRGRDAAAAPGAVGRAFQLIGDRLVEPGCSVRAMPCAAIRILLGIRRFGQRAMHLSGVRAPLPPGTPPSAPADGGSAPGRRARSAPPPRPARSLRPRSRVARPPATTT